MFAVVIAVVRAAPTEILPHERTQSRCVAQLHVLEQAAEAPCHTHDAQLLELGASPVRAQSVWIDGVAPYARFAESHGGTIAQALLASFAVGVETVDPVVRNVAALDGSVDDVCVFHNTKFFKCSCMFSKIAAKVQFCASVVKSSAHFFQTRRRAVEVLAVNLSVRAGRWTDR